MPTEPYALPSSAATGAQVDSRALFGQVMGLVAFTAGFCALGAYIGRHLANGTGLLFFLGAFAVIIGLNVASARRHQTLATALLFALGLLLGIAVGGVLNQYAKTDPGALYQASGATAIFMGGFGAYGYATRRDLSSWARGLFWALLALIGFGLVTFFIAIPGGNIIYSVLGLVVFAAYTIFDFNRLKRVKDERLAVPIAAGIFLDLFNVFLFFLSLFGGGGRR